MTVHVFAGPSLDPAAVTDPTAVCHPPVAHGDLYGVGAGPGDAVLVVDGVYQHRAPVRHKELLELCARGVAVYGAASLGALRARELDGFGMTGLGTVHGWYRDGRLDADADVALVHGDDDVGFRAFGHAVVSVLGVLDRLALDGGLDPDDVAPLLALTRGVHFTERSSGALRAAARAAGREEQMRRVLDELGTPEGDVKRTDAARAVAHVCARHGNPVPAPPAVAPLTSYRREWALDHAPAGPGLPPARRVLAYAQLFLPDWPALHTDHVLARLDPEHPRVGAERAAWLDALDGSELVARGLLAPAERAGLTAHERRTRVLVRSFRLRSGRLVYDDLPAPVLARREELADQCARVLALGERAAATHATFHPADVPADTLLETFRELWRVDDVATHLLDRGFRDREDFVTQARPFFLGARAALAMARRREQS